MAGVSKPEDNLLVGSKKECTNHIFLSDINTSPYDSYRFGKWSNLFNGHAANHTGLYASYDMIIEFRSPVNIYGISLFNFGSTIMHIFDESHVNLDNKYKINYGNCNNEWKLMFKNIQPSIYIFNSGLNYNSNDSVFSEWFIEFVDIDFNLIFNDGYFTISKEQYDITGKKFIEIFTKENQSIDKLFINNSVKLSDICRDITINDETFKPIDKFQDFKIRKIKI